jgi:hypothetical protein
VEFVHDYVQLRFDGPSLTIHAPAEVQRGDNTKRSGTPGYRDALCERIGSSVTSTELRQGEELYLRFADGAAIRISLRPQDSPGPEAIEFRDEKEWWVV